MADTKKKKTGSVSRKPGKDNSALTDAIAKKAYEIYEERGREDGRDCEHWLEAEKIVKAEMKKPK